MLKLNNILIEINVHVYVSFKTTKTTTTTKNNSMTSIGLRAIKQ
jgi:hypothetical protein